MPDARASSGIDVLSDLFIARGTPGYIRSDNGPEFVATAVKGWITGIGAKTAYIEPRSPWENGYVQYGSDRPFSKVSDSLYQAVSPPSPDPKQR